MSGGGSHDRGDLYHPLTATVTVQVTDVSLQGGDPIAFRGHAGGSEYYPL